MQSTIRFIALYFFACSPNTRANNRYVHAGRALALVLPAQQQISDIAGFHQPLPRRRPSGQFRRQPVRVETPRAEPSSPRGAGDSRSSPPARALFLPSSACGIAAVFHRVPAIDLPRIRTRFRHAQRRRASAPSRPLPRSLWPGRHSAAQHQTLRMRRPDDRLRAAAVTRRASSSVGASSASSSTPSTSAASYGGFTAPPAWPAAPAGWLRFAPRPASFRLCTERNPQLTAQQATPALRAVSTSTSESPM